MTQAPGRPLHRVTPLRDDPLAAWLTGPQRLRVVMTGWFGWILFAIFIRMLFWAQVLLIADYLHIVDGRLPAVLTMMAAAALIWPVRRMIMRRRNAKTIQLVERSTPKLAVAVDDLATLADQPDGTIVSLVGWIQSGAHLAERVAGEPAIGLAMACHQKYPGVLETLNDFDLVDEAGHIAHVQVAGARMLGESNVNLTDARARRLLVASLDLPVGAMATGWDAFVLRNGDPVMVVGFKQTGLDPTQASMRATPASAAVGSLPSKPLLIFPIAAERRAQAPTMFDFS